MSKYFHDNSLQPAYFGPPEVFHRSCVLLAAGVIILTVSGGSSSQKMWLFPFSPPLNGGDFDHGNIVRPARSIGGRFRLVSFKIDEFHWFRWFCIIQCHLEIVRPVQSFRLTQARKEHPGGGRLPSCLEGLPHGERREKGWFWHVPWATDPWG